MHSLSALSKKFDTQEKCLEFLEQLRWQCGVECPRCKSSSISRIKTIYKFQCLDCRYMFSVTAGTIFHKTHLPLQKWILATFMICNARKGISAKQIERDLHVTYKTAWYLMHRIRRAMKESKFLQKFRGICEADETYLGGKRRGVGQGTKFPHKTAVIGVRERNGGIKAEMIPNVRATTVCGVIRKYVHSDAKMLCTDQLPSYNQLALDYRLERINHELEYVRGSVHTNGIESFWAILKRGFIGTHHKMSVKYLPLYLNEFTYRFNHKDESGFWVGVLSNGCLINGASAAKG